MARRGRREPPIRTVILAGGSGTRFWPLGRAGRPKQVLALDGEDPRPLLRATVERLKGLSSEPPLVVAPRALAGALRAAAPRLPERAWLWEPRPRNTAAAVVLGAEVARRETPGCVVLAVPADHHAAPGARYVRALRAMAGRAAATDAIVVLGIRPTHGTSAYGYLRTGERLARTGSGPVHRVERYVEKPPPAAARRLASDGRHVWGAGTFAFRPEVFLEEARRVLPLAAEPISASFSLRGRRPSPAALARAYARIPSVSVDYGVMEKARSLETLAATGIDWDDLGSFDAVARRRRGDRAGNRVRGDAVMLDARDCVVESDGGVVALLGVEGLVVVRAADAVLVTRRGRGEDVRRVVAALAARGRKDLV